jgi:hypothetical protein
MDMAQTPSAITTAFANLAMIRGIPVNDALLNRVENLASLFLALKDCVTVTGFISTLFLYFKTHYNDSVCSLIATYLSSVFVDDDYMSQVGTLVPDLIDTEESHGTPSTDATTVSESTSTRSTVTSVSSSVSSRKKKRENERPEWLLLLKEAQVNWSLIVGNDGFKKLSNVLSLCLALGLCDAANLDFKVGGMRLFSIGAAPKQASAVDLIDAVFETITYLLKVDMHVLSVNH